MTTSTRSSGVKNQALVGESGKKNQKSMEVTKVRMPVMATNHCQGSKLGVLMCVQPKASKPKKMMAKPFMRTRNGRQRKLSKKAGKSFRRTPVSSPLHLFSACVEHGGNLKQAILEAGTGVYSGIAHTIMNPGVIAPSHIPRTKRTANKPPKSLQAAWHSKAIDQMKIFMLVWGLVFKR